MSPVRRNADICWWQPLLVHEGEHAEVGPQRFGDRLGHLVGRLAALEAELARRVLDADLDLHGGLLSVEGRSAHASAWVVPRPARTPWAQRAVRRRAASPRCPATPARAAARRRAPWGCGRGR